MNSTSESRENVRLCGFRIPTWEMHLKIFYFPWLFLFCSLSVKTCRKNVFLKCVPKCNNCYKPVAFCFRLFNTELQLFFLSGICYLGEKKGGGGRRRRWEIDYSKWNNSLGAVCFSPLGATVPLFLVQWPPA